MEQTKEQTILIEKLVKANPKYSGNEDLLEDFCSETYQKSYLILQSITDIVSLEGYMKKVVSSAIMDVLKKDGRLTAKRKKTQEKTDTKQDNSENNSIENIINNEQDIVFEQTDINIEDTEIESVQLQDASKIAYEYKKAPLLAQNLLYIADPRENIEEQIIGQDIIENIISLVKKIDSEKPQEMFFVLFKERYLFRKKQREIAQDMGISQAEVSKRLVQLSRLIKEKLY